jgi:hypothetical protein
MSIETHPQPRVDYITTINNSASVAATQIQGCYTKVKHMTQFKVAGSSSEAGGKINLTT